MGESPADRNPERWRRGPQAERRHPGRRLQRAVGGIKTVPPKSDIEAAARAVGVSLGDT